MNRSWYSTGQFHLGSPSFWWLENCLQTLTPTLLVYCYKEALRFIFSPWKLSLMELSSTLGRVPLNWWRMWFVSFFLVHCLAIAFVISRYLHTYMCIKSHNHLYPRWTFMNEFIFSTYQGQIFYIFNSLCIILLSSQKESNFASFCLHKQHTGEKFVIRVNQVTSFETTCNLFIALLQGYLSSFPGWICWVFVKE